jgi:hypothetical protein
MECVKAGGYLAVSGIESGNFGEFKSGFRLSDMTTLRVMRERNWCAVLYKSKHKSKKTAGAGKRR